MDGAKQLLELFVLFFSSSAGEVSANQCRLGGVRWRARMGVRVCVGACACACAARGTPCMHARTHVHTRRSPLRRGARTGPPPTHRSQTKSKQFHTHTNLARADRCATHSSTRHATPSVCSVISLRSRHRFDFRLCWWSPRSIEGAAASEWRHGGAPTSAALVATTLFFPYCVGCWCEATRRHALLPQHCRWPVRCCLGQFARR